MEASFHALLLIDVQCGFDDPRWGKRNNPHAEDRVAALLAHWRAIGFPIIHIQHLSNEPGSPLRADHPGSAIKPQARPAAGELLFTKCVNSAFIGTDLELALRERGIAKLTIAGLTSDHCVSTTARMAANLGFDVQIASDGTAAFDRRGPDGRVFPAEEVHQVSMASLHGEFARVMTSAEIMLGAQG